MTSGLNYLAKNEYSEAILQFKNAAQAMPMDAEPFYQAGVASLKQGSVKDALARFQKALQLNPKHEGAQLRLAELLTVSENPDLLKEGERRLREMLNTSPANPDVLDTLAFAELQLGKPDDAQKRLQESLAKFPPTLKTSVILARLKLSQNDFAGAEAALKDAARREPQSADAALALGQLYRLAGKRVEGEAEIRRALSIQPKSGTALTSLAAIQLASGRRDEADLTYRKLSELPDRQYWPLHATFLLQQGKGDAALAEFQKLAKASPGDRGARTRLLAAYVAARRLPEAEKLMDEALQQNPKDAAALLARGQLYLRSGKSAAAEADLRQVSRYQPESAAVHLGLAEIYARQGAPLRERQELTEALRLKPDLLTARMELSQALLKAGGSKTALEVMDETPAAQKNTLPAIVARNWVLMSLGAAEEFRQGVDQAMALAKPPTTDLLLQKASLMMGQKDYSGARARVQDLLRQNPEDERAWQVLADSYRLQKQPAKALEELQAAAAQHPQSSALHLLLGRWLVASGDHTGARAAFAAAQAANPQSAAVNLALAQLAISEGHPELARSTLTSLLLTAPQNVPARLMLAAIEEKAGDVAAATTQYQAVVGLDRGNLLALNNLAYLAAKSHPEEALQYAQQAVEYAPENASVQDTLGWIYYRKGLYRLAVEHLKEAVTKEGTPLRHFHLGMAYLKNGDQEIGQRNVSAALAADRTLRDRERDW
jgi:tetratricopeptide (TPR) repeat protein